MTARCANCDREIKTGQEVTATISESVREVWNSSKGFLSGVKDVAMEIADSIEIKIDLEDLLDGLDAKGVLAGPLNTAQVECPHCGEKGRWVDV